MGNKKINIIIVDSGVDDSHKKFKDLSVNSFTFQNKTLLPGATDELGHGTAVFGIISCVSDFANIVNIKIPNIEKAVCEDELIHILQYINSNLDCDILNLSMGINVCSQHKLLKKCCDDLSQRGIIIISAFDNNGAISYPAAFENVIGVVSGSACNRTDDFQYYDDDVINIAAKGGIQRVAWKNAQYSLVSGNSFACAHVTVQVARFLRENQLERSEIMKKFSLISKNQNELKYKFNNSQKFNFKINRAAIFPFNKEMHSLIRYSHLLNFEITDVYDVKYSSNVGSSTSFLMNDACNKSYIIKNVNEIDWDAFDTLVIGHTNRLSSLINDQEIKLKLLHGASLRNKQIYSFDDLTSFGYNISDNIYFPIVTSKDVPPFRYGMLYRVSKPVVGVFGTSSQQGKFTLQLKIREKLLASGYDVGQIGSEPSSMLFEMDYCYPMGYNSSVYIKDYDQIRYLNYIINDLCEKNKDIILVGSQSGTVPYDNGNIRMFTSAQFHFLMGTQPDCVVLLVNPFDDFLYIRRTIAFIESSVRCKVISLVIFPMDIKNDWSRIYGKRDLLSKDKCEHLRETLMINFRLPTFVLGDDDDMNKLVDLVIDFFSK